MQFADGVALMARKDYPRARQCLNLAYNEVSSMFGPGHPDALHIKLFSVVLMLLEGNREAYSQNEFQAAQGILKVWEGIKASAMGTGYYEKFGGLVPQAVACYQQSANFFKEAIPLLEAGLGPNHPELAGPLADYSGVLRGLGLEAEADRMYNRAISLPATTLSPHMIGGGVPILVLDPFGNNRLLPSQTPQ